MKRLPISICMVSGAEAHRITPALASVAEWAEEIIIVLNQEVADGTDQIAGSFQAKIYREPWRGFVGQKNSAAHKATQPWILGLDADEVVSQALGEEIQQLFIGGQPPESAMAFSCPRCTFYCGRWIRHGDWYPDRVVRLWRKEAATWEGIEPHAYLKVGGPVGRLRNDLLHFSNESIDRQISKIIPYSNDFVRHCRAQQRPAGLFDLAVRPSWRFLRAYFFRLGFLDGWQGYFIAWLSAFSTLARYAKVREAVLPTRES